MPSGCMGMPVCMPAMSLPYHMGAWAYLFLTCFVQAQPLSSVGVPVCTPDVFRCYRTVPWHTRSHTCLVSAPTHDVLGSSVLTSAKFQGYHVVVQVCLLAHQPCPNNAVCWHRHTSFLTCHAPMPSCVGTGMPVHMPAMSQHCNLAAGACLFAHLPYPITAK